MSELAGAGDWVGLQNKVFTHYISQKVAKRQIKVADCVKEMTDGMLLIQLLEVLSEKTFTGKIEKNPKLEVQKLDNISQALKFCWECGVEMKIKPAPDSLFKEDQKVILGLVWAIMLRFMKFGEDDEDQTNAKDALRMWVANKTAGYAGVQIQDMSNSFRDGLALCALVHKHREKSIDFASLSAADGAANIRTAQEAAKKYFLLEPYLTPEEVQKLDDNSMVVYIGDYYVAFAEMRKLETAAKRISKVIKLTKENDAARAEYKATGEKWVALRDASLALLNDRTIDNTMAGAKARLAAFHKYKKDDKTRLTAWQMDLHQIFNSLALRLKHNNRPEFVPPEGQSLKDIDAGIATLDKLEAERQVELYAELNRQIKLVKLDSVHKQRHEAIVAWCGLKKAYLEKKEVVDSVSAAQLQIRLLDAYVTENKAIFDGSVAKLKLQGAELEREKYEKHGEVAAREKKVDELFAELEALEKKKRPVLEDDLAREEFKEKVLLLVKTHEDSHSNIMAWVADKEKYLATKEESTNVAEARAQVTLLEKYEREKESMHSGSVVPLKELGAQILAQEYKTEYSQWKYPKPAEITGQEQAIDAKWASLSASSAAKKAVLEADLAREVEKERLRLEFAHLAAQFERWSKEQIENAQMSTFGFNLQEVEAYRATMDAENKAIEASAAAQIKAATEVFDKAKGLGVTENTYTAHNLETLAGLRGDVEKAISARTEAYEKELAHQRHLDNLCKAFADTAVPFLKWLTETKDKTNVGGDDLEAQVAFVNERLANFDAESKVSDSKAKFDELEKEGIQYNPHTTVSHSDVEVAHSQYKVFLDKKKIMLDQAIEHKRLRGLSQQDFDDIDKNFTIFDKDKSGNISKKELKACLYSLGVETTKAEIEAYLTKYGNGTAVPKAGFTELMLTIVGVTDTKENIMSSFSILNQEAVASPVITKTKMEVVMEASDIEYVIATAPQKDGGSEYAPWVEDVFAR